MATTKNRRKIIIFVCVILLSAVVCANMLNSKNKNMIEYKLNPDLVCLKPDWKGNIVINGRFYNDTVPGSASLLDAIKWKLSKNPQKEEKENENYSLDVERINNFNKKADKIIWLGHATFFIQLDGVRIITDPVFGNVPTAKRKVELPCDADSIINIDYLLVSHDHLDHFSKKSIEQLSQNNPTLKALAPLGAKRLFNSKILKNIPLQEAGWYQEYNIDDEIRIIFLPAKHWGRRSLNDYNKTLWGSFLIISKMKTVFFAGDSAYGDIFADIHNLFGGIDICILPIGAYSPRYMMEVSHVTPEEALQAFNDLNGKIFIPMHYGTFDLSDEPMGEPIKRLRIAASENGESDNIKELKVGAGYFIDNMIDKE